MLNYISDAFLSQIIVNVLSIVCWRSAGNIWMLGIYPNDVFSQNIATAALGIACSVLLLALQVPLGKVSETLDKRPLLKLVWEDTIYFIVFLVVTMLWIGLWNLNTEYVLKEMPLGGWVNHVVGTMGLLVMQTYSEVSAFGITLDGTDPRGKAFFPTHYLRHFLKNYYSQDETSKDGFTLKTIERTMGISERFIGEYRSIQI